MTNTPSRRHGDGRKGRMYFVPATTNWQKEINCLEAPPSPSLHTPLLLTSPPTPPHLNAPIIDDHICSQLVCLEAEPVGLACKL